MHRNPVFFIPLCLETGERQFLLNVKKSTIADAFSFERLYAFLEQ
jgi:hypothetical protein